MNAHDLRTPSAMQAQANLERLLAARRSARSEFRADVKAPFRPMTRVNVPAPTQTVPAWVAWAAMIAFSLCLTALSCAAIKWLLPMFWRLP